MSSWLKFGFILLWSIPLVTLAATHHSDTVTAVTLRADALAKGYTVVYSNGTVWVGIVQRSIQQTKRVRVKISQVTHPDRFPAATETFSDFYRYSISSHKDFQVNKPLRLRMAYAASAATIPKVLKYWNTSTRSWKRLKGSHDDPTTLTITAKLRHKHALIGVFPKAVSADIVVQGLASWYDGTGAACNAFPIGSVIRVANVDTGMTVDSTVASTGPFVPNRIVDLPREQFSQIADLSAGVVSVTVQRIQ